MRDIPHFDVGCYLKEVLLETRALRVIYKSSGSEQLFALVRSVVQYFLS